MEKQPNETIEQVVLITVANDIEGDNIVALLDSCGIPAYCKHDGIGGYLKVFMGSVSIGGVDVYVLKEQLPEATEALEAAGMLGEWEPVPDDYQEGQLLEEEAPPEPETPELSQDKSLSGNQPRKMPRKVILIAVGVVAATCLVWLIASFS